LSQVQAKQSVEIPEEIFTMIIAELKKQKFHNFKLLEVDYMKAVLKTLNLSKYYEYCAYLVSKLSGNPPPVISKDVEDKFRLMFDQIQPLYVKYKPKNRTNLFSYPFFFHKACELHEQDHLIKYFPYLRSPEKLRVQDRIWKKICKELRWQYIPSSR